jgi:DNA-binding transcriptional MerR regulator
VSAQRLGNGYRDYDERAVRLVREVNALGALGIKAEQTRPFLDCLVSGNAEGDDCPASLETYRTAIADMNTRIDDLTQRRDALIALLASASDRAEPLCDLTPNTRLDLQEIRS